MNLITTRQATPSDLDTLAPLFDAYRQFYGRASDLDAARQFLRERFNHGESALFLAHHGNDAVGLAQLYPTFSSVSMARTYVLNDLFVRESARQLGVARQLLTAVADYARALGGVRLSLCTAHSNTVAQSVYQAAGWARDTQFAYFHQPL